MLLILCVDGLDYDMVIREKHHLKVNYYKKLDIPIENYVYSGKVFAPHTTRVWASMFSGLKIDYGIIYRRGIRKMLHDVLLKLNIKWTRKGDRNKYRVNPYNEDLDIVFDHYNSFVWNMPTISPEWLSLFPNLEKCDKYCKREYLMFNIMTYGSLNTSFDVVALYTRYIDYLGHRQPDKLVNAYYDVFNLLESIKNKCDYVIISDHGIANRLHTENAFVGSSMPINATSIEHIRSDIERILKEINKK